MHKLLENWQHRYREIFSNATNKIVSAEELLDNVARYYQDIISCMPGNVYWFDTTCIAVGCNQNVLRMLGLKSIDQFKGLSFEEMGKVARWEADATLSFLKDTLEVIRTAEPKLNIVEPPIPGPDGNMIHFLTSRVPIFNVDKKVIGVVGISTDITELKRTQLALSKAKEEAEAASRAKSEFVANMSHDVKTPLAGIIGISELLSFRLSGENTKFANPLLRAGKQLLNFFNNCVTAFKLENAEVVFSEETFNLKDLLNEIFDLFHPAILTKSLHYSVNYPSDAPQNFIGSRVGVYRVLLNLVGNAVKFTAQGDIKINIETSLKPNAQAMLKLSVIDTGIGIPKDKQKMIFEGFTRVTPSYKGIYEGSGIGLYIVQKFVTAMGGEINVQSEENIGSQISVELPIKFADKLKKSATDLLDTQSNIANLSIEDPATSASDIPRHILLVEDNYTAQLMESYLLASISCEVEIADCGEKALELFEPGKYDLIFMDIGLPGMQGDATAKLIRKIEINSQYRVPIIALTAHTTEDINKAYLNSGMDGVYSKPLSREQAKEIIDYYAELRNRPSQKKLALQKNRG